MLLVLCISFRISPNLAPNEKLFMWQTAEYQVKQPPATRQSAIKNLASLSQMRHCGRASMLTHATKRIWQSVDQSFATCRRGYNWFEFLICVLDEARLTHVYLSHCMSTLFSVCRGCALLSWPMSPSDRVNGKVHNNCPC